MEKVLYDFEVASVGKLIELIDSKIIRERFVDKLIEHLKSGELILHSQYNLVNEVAWSVVKDIV